VAGVALRIARVLAAAAAEVLAPTRCAACDEAVSPSRLFCSACAVSVLAWPRERPRGRTAVEADAAFAYGGAVATAIARFKYRGRADLGPRLGEALAARAASWAPPAPRVDVVVPVPLHPRRLAERGFNPSALLASVVASRLGVPHAARALDRVRDTPRQAELDRRGRTVNVAGAFACRARSRIEGRRVMLVDDVRTTGATLAAAASALRAAHAREVVLLTLAVKDTLDEG
jgi:ComF family protein